MSDVGWGSDHLEPPRKSGIPGWLIGCAGGCMFLVGASAVALYFGGRWVQDRLEQHGDPKVQWPALAEVLPHETPPPGFEIARLPIPFLELWRLSSPDEDAVIYVGSAPNTAGSERGDAPFGEMLAAWYREPGSAPMFAGSGGRLETRADRIELQGRTFDCLRLERAADGVASPPSAPVEPLAPETPVTVTPAPPPRPGEDAPTPRPGESGARVIPEPPSPEQGLPDWQKSLMAMVDPRLGGNGIAIDVTPEHGDARVIVWLVRRTAGETVSNEDAARLLAPFAIGTVR